MKQLLIFTIFLLGFIQALPHNLPQNLENLDNFESEFNAYPKAESQYPNYENERESSWYDDPSNQIWIVIGIIIAVIIGIILVSVIMVFCGDLIQCGIICYICCAPLEICDSC